MSGLPSLFPAESSQTAKEKTEGLHNEVIQMKKISKWLYRKITRPELRLTFAAFYGILTLGGPVEVARISAWMVKNARTSKNKKAILSSMQARGQQGNRNQSGHGRVPGVRAGNQEVRAGGASDGLRGGLPRETDNGTARDTAEEAEGAFRLVPINPHKKCPDCGNDLGILSENDSAFLTCSQCGYDSRRQSVSMQSSTS